MKIEAKPILPMKALPERVAWPKGRNDLTAGLWAFAEDLKKMDCWGAQNGLLSVAELARLMELIWDAEAPHVLELGHYYGFSTCGLAAVLRARFPLPHTWCLVTVDAHIPDAWVKTPAPWEAFQANRQAHFPDTEMICLQSTTQDIIPDGRAPFAAPVVFYDADHGDEQIRVMKRLALVPEVRLIILDDRDLGTGPAVMEYLTGLGWQDFSPPLHRGGADKEAPDTMTLGVLARKGAD